MKKIKKLLLAAGMTVAFLSNTVVVSGEETKEIKNVNSGSTFLNLRSRPVISENYWMRIQIRYLRGKEPQDEFILHRLQKC